MIYIKTALGLAAMQDRSPGMTSRQRSAFIMFDGKRSASDVLSMTSGIGITSTDLEHLVSLGFLAVSDSGARPSEPSDPISQPVAVAPSKTPDGMPTLSAQEHYSLAYPIATRLTAGLGLRGFLLNLAVEAAGDLEKLKELSPRIKDAVGAEKYKELHSALNF